VVPRSFVGALAISIVAKPAHAFLKFDSKFDFQIVARGLLGVFNGFCLIILRHEIEEWASPAKGLKVKNSAEDSSAKTQARYASLLSFWFAILTVSQFHLMFYSSRTLPNMFALPMVVLGYRYVLREQYFAALSLIGFATIVFRIELVLLWAGLAISALIFQKSSIQKIIQAGFLGVGFGAVLSCAVDSYFWQQFPIIPEIDGFLFNAVQGKSSEWGEEPWWSYFLVHIPNMLSNPVLIGILPLGLFSDPSPKKTKALSILFGASVIFVSIYSFHAHKEWRFVIYVVPVISLIAANAVALLMTAGWSTKMIRVVALMLIGSSVLVGFAGEAIKSLVSSYNYSGGVALAHFHEYIHEHYGLPPVLPTTKRALTVHLDVLTCMTGASKFGQLYDNAVIPSTTTNSNYIIYDKTEDTHRLSQEWINFDYVITGVDLTKAKLPCVRGHNWELVKAVDGLAGFDIKPLEEVVGKVKEGRVVELVGEVLAELNQHGLTNLVSQTVSALVRLEPQVFIYRKVTTKDGFDASLHCKWIDLV
jgi:alpha-1,6-mannosyltransferase